MAKRQWTRAKRWSETIAREVVAAQEESGETVAEFARRERISAERLYRWRARLSHQAALEFIEVRRPEPASPMPIVLLKF